MTKERIHLPHAISVQATLLGAVHVLLKKIIQKVMYATYDSVDITTNNR